jgi:hypothetical protein
MVLSILVTEFLLLSSSEAPFFRCLFYQQIFSHEISSVQHGNSSPGFPLCGHLHECNTSPLASLPVRDNLDRHDVSSFGEKGFEFSFAGLGREIGYVNLLIHLFPFILQSKVGDNSKDISLAETLHAQ